MASTPASPKRSQSRLRPSSLPRGSRSSRRRTCGPDGFNEVQVRGLGDLWIEFVDVFSVSGKCLLKHCPCLAPFYVIALGKSPKRSGQRKTFQKKELTKHRPTLSIV